MISDETVDSAVVTKIADISQSATSSNSFITDVYVDPNDNNHLLVTVGFYDQTTNIYMSNIVL